MVSGLTAVIMLHGLGESRGHNNNIDQRPERKRSRTR